MKASAARNGVAKATLSALFFCALTYSTVVAGDRHLTGVPLPNDDCVDGIVIADGVFPLVTLGATTDGQNGPAWDGTAGACGELGDTQIYEDVWFDYIAQCDGIVQVGACNDGAPLSGDTDFDVRIAIYDTCACVPNGPQLVCMDNDPGCAGGSIQAFAPVTLAQCYKIRVGGAAPLVSGLGNLGVICQPLGLCGNGACEGGDGEDICTCETDCGLPDFEETPGLSCQDAADNDCDGLTDCLDPDCAADLACLCGDDICEFGIGENACTCKIDCGTAVPSETPGIDCTDGIDNDCDGDADCNDRDCNLDPVCACGNMVCQAGLGEDSCTCPSDCGMPPISETDCVDGVDEDCDGPTDCLDPDCALSPDCACGNGACEPGFGEDRCTCPDDCGPPPPNEIDCVNGEDEDCDGATDCLDPDCAGDPNCSCGNGMCQPGFGEDRCTCPADCGPPPPFEAPNMTCQDGVDNDCDGDPDCLDADCNADPSCSAASVCPLEGLNTCQFPNQAPNGGVVAATSDGNFMVADNFTAISDGIVSGACWWGSYADFDANGADCAQVVPDEFTITYYQDVGDPTPGNVHAGPFNVGPGLSTPTGNIVGGLQEFSFSMSHPPVPVQAGDCYWIEVQNQTNSNDTCVWLWATSPQGDGLSAQDQGTIYTSNAYDLSWCLDMEVAPAGCEVTGACCLDSARACTDDVTLADCAEQNGRFSEATLCSALDPPCGTGGCCDSAGGCTNELEEACTGDFHQAGLFCAPGGQLLCNAYNECNFDNGPGDLALDGVDSQYDAGVSYAEGSGNYEHKGDGDNECRTSSITFWVQHRDGHADPGGCFEGRCSGNQLPCDTRDESACNGGLDGTCDPENPNCTDTPDDYEGIRLTIYPDGTLIPDVESYLVNCGDAIPQSLDLGGSATCISTPDCDLGQVCIDNDGDGDSECAAVCMIDVPEMGQPPIGDVNVDLLISHGRQGDLVVSVEHAGLAQPVTVLRKPGDSTLHGVGFGELGYVADDFGDTVGGGDALLLDDQAGVDINTYDDIGPGVDRYPGPARSGGGIQPSGVLNNFNGQPRSGLWLVYVTDEFGGARSGTIDEWSLHFAADTGDPKGPDGEPQYLTSPFDCVLDSDCIIQGCDPGTQCINNHCDLGGTPCGSSLPSGAHDGNTHYDLLITPDRVSWMPYGAPEDRAFEITLDLTGLAVDEEKNEKDWLTLAPQLAGDPYYRTTWMKSENKDGNPDQKIAPSAEQESWTPADGINDLAFRIEGDKTGGGDDECPNGTAAECCDLDMDGVIDDVCTWCECAPVPFCNVITTIVPSDVGGAFGACPPDTFCNIHDYNHTLTCFANTNPCESINIDAGGMFGTCPPDGFCNIHDANHTLTCFGGTNPCSCGPAPAAPSVPVGETRLEIIASRRTIQAGDLVDVRIFSNDPIEDLQSYQLHAEPTGGKNGQLVLQRITIESRKDAVFNGADDRFDAVNVTTEQMLAGLRRGGRTINRPAYLATFTYLASGDAEGPFVIDLAQGSDGQTYLIADFTHPVRVSTTKPAIVIVEPRTTPRQQER